MRVLKTSPSRLPVERVRARARTGRRGHECPTVDIQTEARLSRKALSDFTAWFLRVCLDQVTFMSGLFDLDTLVERLRIYVQRRDFKPEALHILEQVLQRGELARGEAGRVSGLKERSARELLAALILDGILGSDTPKGPVSLRFSLDAIEILFPSLFPET
jgi:hypothetical protein